MKTLHGTRFDKAAKPRLAGSLNLTDRIIGQNKRKQKLTESPGTNPSKLGGGSLMSDSKGLTQNSAPYKHEVPKYPIGVGGPVFDQLTPKVPK